MPTTKPTEHASSEALLHILDGEGIRVPVEISPQWIHVYRLDDGLECRQGDNKIRLQGKEQLHDHIVALAKAYKRIYGN